ncbi:MAG: ferrous iron transporter B [Acetobacteraceae bacterium]|nr:ferrous iron transporter B [Acetobacteraceae bacterium]
MRGVGPRRPAPGGWGRPARGAGRLLAIVGPPNVGKSVIFNRLTGAYATVSNYPGTTVEVARGWGRALGPGWQVVDTPGMYSLLPVTGEERVARRLLWEERPAVVLQVADAKNLERMLPLTLALVEAGLPLVLAVNLMDEARRLGLELDPAPLEAALGVPVVPCVATAGEGLAILRRRILEAAEGRLGAAAAGRLQNAASACAAPNYGPLVEAARDRLRALLPAGLPLSPNAVALLLIQGDGEVLDWLRRAPGIGAAPLEELARAAGGALGPTAAAGVAEARQRCARLLAARALNRRRGLEPPRAPDRGGARRAGPGRGFAEVLGRALTHPVLGPPVAGAVIYFGLYRFVGVWVAGRLVGGLEQTYRAGVEPLVRLALERWVPWPAVRDLLGGEFGLFTLALRYSLAIVLPIVGAFFLVFSVLEDTGYLPRLALLSDRLLKGLGLSGRAVIPLSLGFGCDTMATLVSRTLEDRRERVLATLLLALAVPCSAQLGVMLALLSPAPRGLAVWALFVGGVSLGVGALAGRLLPGRRPAFYLEVPPLRLPRLSNLLAKMGARLRWYLAEVIPVFCLASLAIWAGRVTGALPWLERALGPVLAWLGLPPGMALVLLLGFLRRDYGAAGLFDLRSQLTTRQLVVAASTLTLFIPCVAQLAVMIRERGALTALAIATVVGAIAFGLGGLLNLLLSVLPLGL